jgi:hypothetical protein
MSISLNSALKICRFNAGDAARLQSDRFLNPEEVSCPLWNGKDNLGRNACVDSYYTKSAGCNYASDRIVVENNLRPQYSQYITLDAGAIAGDMYPDNLAAKNALQSSREADNVYEYTGNPGIGYRSVVQSNGCGMYNYRNATAQSSQAMRNVQNSQNTYQKCSMSSVAGI